MGTFELLIVFAALMAVISLVAIAIDWVGRPLKNRRFIPRIYRYEDEVSPAEAYEMAPPLVTAGPPLSAAPPVSVTPPPMPAPAPVQPRIAAPPPASMAPTSPPIVKPAATTVAAELAPRPPIAEPVADATVTTAPATTAPATTSAFQDTIDAEPADTTEGTQRPRGIAETVHEQSAAAWTPDLPLDARVDDANPTPDEKAQRYWIATADAVGATTHFDDVNLARMHQGKAPTRRNPRTGDVEAMELVGLRAGSHRSDVRMKWPDETVDPWSAS